MSLIRTIFVVGLLILISFVGFTIGGFLWYSDAVTPLSQTFVQPCEISITQGMNPKEIAYLLKSKGVIRSAFLFKFLIAFYAVDNRLRPGAYSFSRGENIDEVIQMLLIGREERIKITIPEGWTIPMIADSLEKSGICSAASFSAAVWSPQILNKIFRDWGDIKSPEGLAFPETYTFTKGLDSEEIAEIMLAFTRDKVDKVFIGNSTSKLSKYQTCILSSIIEREAKLTNERPLVASVFMNRLKNGMRLESCATVQYALPHHKERLTFDDLKVNSPFNTYLNSGLPPTPISNFGEASLLSAISPPDTQYLFFVSNASEGHRFSSTLVEHERSKQIFINERKKNRKPK